MKKIYVGNLPWQAGTGELASLFTPFGEVADSFIVSDRETGRSRGFGFVEMDDDAATEAISSLDGTEYEGRALRVNEANERGDRGGNRRQPVRFDVMVLGAGAAGLVAAREARAAGAGRVLCLEKMPKPGLKILVSGGGHCNLTTTLRPQEAEPLFGKEGGRFLRKALRTTPPRVIREWMHERGVETVEEEYEKVWPKSKRAQDVLDVLLARLHDSGAVLRTSAPVEAIRSPDPTLPHWSVLVGGEWLTTQKLVLALGGCSYPGMGTVGDGYRWLSDLGLQVNEPLPALAGLSSDAAWVKELAGLTLYDVELQLREESGKIVRRRARPLLFTHKGVSGPGPMDLSRDFEREPVRFRNLHVDLLPAHEESELKALLFRGSSQPASILQKRLSLPKRLVRVLIERVDIMGIQGAQVPRPLRQLLIQELKGLCIPIRGSLGFARAEVTTGGVALVQVDPATMEVHGHPGLYLAGELLDVDGPIGGFSFWIAFSTAVLAGRSAAAATKA